MTLKRAVLIVIVYAVAVGVLRTMRGYGAVPAAILICQEFLALLCAGATLWSRRLPAAVKLTVLLGIVIITALVRDLIFSYALVLPGYSPFDVVQVLPLSVGVAVDVACILGAVWLIDYAISRSRRNAA